MTPVFKVKNKKAEAETSQISKIASIILWAVFLVIAALGIAYLIKFLTK